MYRRFPACQLWDFLWFFFLFVLFFKVKRVLLCGKANLNPVIRQKKMHVPSPSWREERGSYSPLLMFRHCFLEKAAIRDKNILCPRLKKHLSPARSGPSNFVFWRDCILVNIRGVLHASAEAPPLFQPRHPPLVLSVSGTLPGSAVFTPLELNTASLDGDSTYASWMWCFVSFRTVIDAAEVYI